MNRLTDAFYMVKFKVSLKLFIFVFGISFKNQAHVHVWDKNGRTPTTNLPSLEYHCSYILLFPSKVHLTCLISSASQICAGPTGHSEVVPFPECLKIKSSMTLQAQLSDLAKYSFSIEPHLEQVQVGCLLLQSSLGGQSYEVVMV